MRHVSSFARSFVLCAIAFGIGASGNGAAQQPDKQVPDPVVAKPEKGSVALGQEFKLAAGEHALPDLVDAAATVLGRNIVWLDSERHGTNLRVTLQNPLKLTPPALEDLLTNLLGVCGYAIAPVDRERAVYEVIALGGQRGREIANRATWRQPADVLARENKREFVTTVVQLEHISAPLATNSLRPFFAASAGQNAQLLIGTAGSNESLVLSGFSDQVAAALRLIAECDKAPRQPQNIDFQNSVSALFAQVQQLQAQVQQLQTQIAALQSQKGAKNEERK